MDERDGEYVVGAQLIDDAPGVRGDFADVAVIELGHAPARILIEVAATYRRARAAAAVRRSADSPRRIPYGFRKPYP